jgi:hypothetical protein
VSVVRRREFNEKSKTGIGMTLRNKKVKYEIKEKNPKRKLLAVEKING